MRILSPVHMTRRIRASRSLARTPVVEGLSLFSNMMNPRNVNPDSASARLSLLARLGETLGSDLDASAMTRYP